jgi:two-component system response regulator PilR (NtrC family)
MEPLPAFHGLVGQSALMRTLFERIQRVAPFDVSILIVGETGTGKELVAAALHRLSSRRSARFEPVNCGALSRELLRSELFGHERGAFTGAVERHPGLLREASGGTVFLDEVGELPLDAQAVLLRFLGGGEVRPVGLTRTLHVDVRIIAATHRELTMAIEQGTFREDLFYRLREVVLRVPSLRERPEDLQLLVEHCRRRFNERYGLGIDGVTRAALRELETYGWPGNVRELEAVLREAMVLKGRGWLGPDVLELPGLTATPPASVTAFGGHVPESRQSRRRRIALRLAAEQGTVSSGQLARACRVSDELARRELVALARLGQLRRASQGPRTRYVLP